MKRFRIFRTALTAAGLLLSATIYAADPWQNVDLPVEQRVDDLLSRLTLDEKVSLMMDVSPAIDRLGIPEYNWWNEALHGVGRAGTATVLPQSIGLAATWNDGLVEDAFSMVSTEARAKYNMFRKEGNHSRYCGLTFWTPNVNIFRDPRWGRGQETYGEDPCLTTRMGVAVVSGLQGPADSPVIKTIAGAKHYAVHSGPEWNRHSFNASDIDPRDLWETYLPSFKALVDANVGQVMCAYNRFEGEPCCSSKRLLTKILRDEWGYDDIIVTDCWAMTDFYREGAHQTHPSEVEASADAVISGTDLECGPVFANLTEAVKRGLISESEIDSHLRRLLRARMELGEICPDYRDPYAGLGAESVDNAGNRRIALDAARQSMTLLKNNGILPLSKSASIVVMGPNANDSVMMWGNYNGYPSHTVTILDGIRDIAGADVPYVRGCDHVVNNNLVSCFGLLKSDGGKGMTARYWNNTEGEGEPVATRTFTSPISISTGGATVVAPGVNLTNFSGLYNGSFTAPADGDYRLTISQIHGKWRLTVNGKPVRLNYTGVDGAEFSGSIHCEAGKTYDIEIFHPHGEGVARLNFDIARAEEYITDPGDAATVIFVGGISPLLEGEEMPVSVKGFRGGDRESIELPEIQRNMIKELKAKGKKVVFVNCSGSAVGLAPEDSICDAILQAWYPGQAGGTAVAEVLFGDYNPAGRLPVTFYRDDSQLPDFEDYSMIGRTYRYMTDKPLYPFGHGLSYTTFGYSSPKLKSKKIAADGGSTKLTVKVENTGRLAGDEVVQLYMRPLDRRDCPALTLCDFRRVNIEPGESAEVTFDITSGMLATFSHETERMKVQPGRYQLLCGGSSAQLKPVVITVK